MTIAYILISDLLESLIVLAIFIAVCVVLPARWLREDFTVRGSLMMYITTFWTCLFTLNSLIGLPSRTELLLMVIGFLTSMGVTGLLVKKNSAMGRFIQGVSERMIIFLYVWIPLSVLAILVVVARSLGRILGAV